jgi:hypothetical protein
MIRGIIAHISPCKVGSRPPRLIECSSRCAREPRTQQRKSVSYRPHRPQWPGIGRKPRKTVISRVVDIRTILVVVVDNRESTDRTEFLQIPIFLPVRSIRRITCRRYSAPYLESWLCHRLPGPGKSAGLLFPSRPSKSPQMPFKPARCLSWSYPYSPVLQVPKIDPYAS